MNAQPIAADPRRALWYWPHPARGIDPVAAELQGRGWDLTVQCLESFDGVRIDRPPTPYRLIADLPDVGRTGWLGRRVAHTAGTQLVRARRRASLLRRYPADVVHIQMAFPPIDATAIPRLRRRGAAVVLVVHDVLAHQGRVPPRLDRATRRLTYGCADGLIALHQKVADELVEVFPELHGRVDVLPPPLAVRDVPPARCRPGEVCRFLVFGSLRANKGIETLLTALRSRPSPGYEVVVAGTGDRRLESLLRQAAVEMPWLQVEIGFATADRKAQLYSSADAVVLPYSQSYSSYSAVLRDAMEFGRPVIASDVGAIGDEVRLSGAGWLVRPDDPHALARSLRHASTSADELARKGAAARRFAVGHSAASTAQLLVDTYDRAIERRRLDVRA